VRIAIWVAAVTLAAAAAPVALAGGKVENRVLADTADGRQASFLIQLEAQADLSRAYSMRDQDARGWYVYRTLKAEADRTQGPLKALLEARGVSFRSYWAANLIAVHGGDRALVEDLAALPDVAELEANDPTRGIADEAPAPPQLNAFLALRAPATLEPGVAKVHAPALWQLGFTGQGIVIGNQDTGVRWTHQALKLHYRGWNGTSANHNYNWHDSIHGQIAGTGNPCGYNTQAPCDDNGHGTHTTGTTSGDDGAGNQIGVAPGAKWIACHNMDQGTGRPETYTECFQWFLAPTDLGNQNPNPALRPHVINNSWGCPTSEGCAPNTLRTIVESSEASGIFVEVSAGNAGPLCSTVTDPPAIYEAAFTTGAIQSSNSTLAPFSSRGPVLVDGSNRLKPNVVAPGVGVRSSLATADSAYGRLNGTSMAGPHVVGVVALLWSARPELVRNIAATKALLRSTADPNVIVLPTQACHNMPTSEIPNNYFGYGLVDALAAYNGHRPPPPPVRCIVPRVVGSKLPAARRKIVRAHCRVGKVRKAFSSVKKRGRVVAQSPRPGRRYARGRRVSLKVGKGPRR
jgi:serine protease AprX